MWLVSLERNDPESSNNVLYRVIVLKIFAKLKVVRSFSQQAIYRNSLIECFCKMGYPWERLANILHFHYIFSFYER